MFWAAAAMKRFGLGGGAAKVPLTAPLGQLIDGCLVCFVRVSEATRANEINEPRSRR